MYDYVSWDMVLYLLGRMGFGEKWMEGLDPCLFSTV